MSIESYLKQQCLDPSGLYNWERKYYRLAVDTGLLEARSTAEAEPSLNNEGKLYIKGAKYAKEWSILTPSLGSYGFDIVWTSDDELTCRNWVQCINMAIQKCLGTAKRDVEDVSDSSRNVSNVGNETAIDPQSPHDTKAVDSQQLPPTQPRYRDVNESSRFLMSPNRAVFGTTVQAAGGKEHDYQSLLSNISHIPHVTASSSGNSGSDSSPESIGYAQQQHQRFDMGPSESNEPTMKASKMSGVANLHTMEFKHESSSNNQDSNYRGKMPIGYKSVEAIELEVEDLRSSLRENEIEMNNRLKSVTAKYAELREKDKKTIAELRMELEERAIQIEAESYGVHAAELKSLKEIHRREIACLAEESLSDRKRHEALISKERALTAAAEERERDLRKELFELTSRNRTLEYEFNKIKESATLENIALAAENERLRTENKQMTDKLRLLREESSLTTEKTLSATVDQMNSRFTETVQSIEKSAYETAKKKFDVQRMQELAAMQMECNKQIETIRLQSKAASEKELDMLRKNYENREQQTMLDLKQLEQLHALRISELEKTLVAWRGRAEKAEENAASALLSAAKGSEASRLAAVDTIRQLEHHADNVESLQTALQQKHDELLESRSREATYREHLNRSIEECRIQRAQNLDSLRQASCDAAQAAHWKRAAQELELSLGAANTSLQIARDEAMMLENEVSRLNSQNLSLQEALDRADKIVYGNAVVAASKSKEPTPAKATKPSLQNTRMASRRQVSKSVYSSISSNENSPNSANKSKRETSFPSKRIMMYY